jgi:CubicO group peptidase (beta-lactamase class C family)
VQSHPSKPTAADSLDKSSQVDALFDSWATGCVPGAAVLVLHEGRVLHNKGYGLADLASVVPITPDTAFLLASITKQFTAMAILILAERGKITIDDRIAGILPEFNSWGNSITIRRLLNHTSGLQDYEALFIQSKQIDEEYPRRSKREHGEFEPTAAEALKMIAGAMPRFAPGDQWEYSNSGYVVLAQIVERVSGMPFAQFLRQTILSPLGMSSSVLYDETKPGIPHRATSYMLRAGSYEEADYTPLNAVYGPDGLYGTPNDLIEWYCALDTDLVMGARRLVSASTLREAFTSGWLNSGANIGYGCGWFLGKSLGLQRVSHTGSWVGFRHLVVHYPDQRFTLLVLSNVDRFDDVARSTLSGRIARIYLSEVMRLPVAVEVSADTLRSYAGKYETDVAESVDIAFEGGSLWIRNSPEPALPQGGLSGSRGIRLVPESEVKFFVDGAEGDSYFFNQDEKGVVRSVTRHLSLFGYATDAYATARRVDWGVLKSF